MPRSDPAPVGVSASALLAWIREGGDVDGQDTRGRAALHFACFDGRTECARALVAHGANPNIQTGAHDTPLHSAAVHGHLACMQVLLDAGADVSLATLRSRETPLHVAAKFGHAACVRLLLENGADPHARSTQRHSCIDMAPTGELKAEMREVAAEIRAQRAHHEQRSAKEQRAVRHEAQSSIEVLHGLRSLEEKLEKQIGPIASDFVVAVQDVKADLGDLLETDFEKVMSMLDSVAEQVDDTAIDPLATQSSKWADVARLVKVLNERLDKHYLAIDDARAALIKSTSESLAAMAPSGSGFGRVKIDELEQLMNNAILDGNSERAAVLAAEWARRRARIEMRRRVLAAERKAAAAAAVADKS